MAKLARFIVDNAKLIIAATLLINIAAVASFYRAAFDASIYSILKTDEEDMQEFFALSEKYGGADTIMAVVSSEQDMTRLDSLLAFWEYQERLGAISGVSSVTSFIPPVIPGRRLFVSTDAAAIDENYPELLSLLGRQDGMFANLLSEDRKTAAVQLNFSQGADAFAVIESVREVSQPPGMEVSLTGSQIVFETLWKTITRVIFIFPPISLLILLALFYFNVKSAKLTLAALLPAAFGALWMLQTMFWPRIPLGIVLVISPLFVMVMGSADGLHFVVHYLQNAGACQDRYELTERTMREVGIPIILTTVTTMVGFLSLLFSSVRPLQRLGLFSSLGIGYAGLISFFFLPALLSKIKIKKEYQRGALSERILKYLVPLVRRPVIPMVLFLGVVVASLIAIPRLTVYSNQLLFFRKSSEIRRSFELVEERLGSSQPILGEFVLEAGAGSAAEPEGLYLLEREMEKLPGIHRVTSVVDMLKFLYEARLGREGFPPPAIIRGMLGLVPQIESLVQEDGILFYAFVRDWDTAKSHAVLEFAADRPEIRTVTGTPILFSRLNELVVQTQRNSLAITASGVLLLLLVIFRRFRTALVAMLPIAVTVVGINGLLYYAGFHLNILTATISSIAVGVGIDYAIHLIFAINYHRKRGVPEHAITALHSTGIPILANAMGIGIGILSLLFSPLRLHVQAAAVISFAMFASSLGALILIPAFFPSGLGYSRVRELFRILPRFRGESRL